MPLTNQSCYDLFNHLGSYRNIMLSYYYKIYTFRLVLEGKTGKEISESSRLELLEKTLAKNFALSDAEGNTSGLLNRGGFWEVIDSFVLIAYTSLVVSRTL